MVLKCHNKGNLGQKVFFPLNCGGSIAAYHWGSELSLHIFNLEHKAEAANRNQEKLWKLKAQLYFLQETSHLYGFYNSPNDTTNLEPNVQILLSIWNTPHSTEDKVKDVQIWLSDGQRQLLNRALTLCDCIFPLHKS